MGEAQHLPLAQIIPAAVFLVVIVGLFWWVVVRPANKRAKEHIELVKSLAEGDRIVTAGGIYGVVKKVHDRTVEIEVSPQVVLIFDKYAVRKRQD